MNTVNGSFGIGTWIPAVCTAICLTLCLAQSGCNDESTNGRPMTKPEEKPSTDQATAGVVYFGGKKISISGNDLADAQVLFNEIQDAASVPGTLDATIEPSEVLILKDEHGQRIEELLFYPTEYLVQLSGDTFELQDDQVKKLHEFFRRIGRSGQE